MTTRVTEGARRERHAALVSRVSRLCPSRACALLSLNLKKKRDCSQSNKFSSLLPYLAVPPKSFAMSSNLRISSIILDLPGDIQTQGDVENPPHGDLKNQHVVNFLSGTLPLESVSSIWLLFILIQKLNYGLKFSMHIYSYLR